ncbi:hypothetical protein WJX81_005276 [Elliptochloris bilobata]|uniref:Plastid lipid-associated protein/fibrillin conserved domain-containing protein n=1 Tax=Elliptochloris bilobata TaxID=381761 RepID=A0AAW1S5Q1_9CHLO
MQRAAAAVDSSTSTVEEVLNRIAGSDGGEALPEEEQARVDALLEELEEAPRQDGKPAGGRFRTRWGRALFNTTGLFQSVLEPDLATNKVAFRLFGCVPGHVGLRGTVEPIGDDRDTVKVRFQRPELLLPGLALRIGPSSSVQLATTYLDARVRLGRGSRGSRFVFTRGGAADQAGMDAVGLHRTSLLGWTCLAVAGATCAWRSAALWRLGSLAARCSAVACGLLAAALVLAVWVDRAPLARLRGA